MAVSSTLVGVRVIPSGGALGADIVGLDLSQPLDAAAIEFVKDAWAEHQVLRFRGQRLDDVALKRFSEYFGELDLAPITTTGSPHLPEHPYVAVMSNIMADGKPVGSLGSYEASWHTDMSYNAEPPSASLLYALEIPPAGGDTWFGSMYAAYDALPDELRARIAGRSINYAADTKKSKIRARRRAPSIRSCARTRSRARKRSSSGAAATRTWSAFRSRRARRYSTSYSRTPATTRTPGSNAGMSAISSSGTIAA
jgi:alpha-ketoglutarate-dependent taurine dioxygenase